MHHKILSKNVIFYRIFINFLYILIDKFLYRLEKCDPKLAQKIRLTFYQKAGQIEYARTALFIPIVSCLFEALESCRVIKISSPFSLPRSSGSAAHTCFSLSVYEEDPLPEVLITPCWSLLMFCPHLATKMRCVKTAINRTIGQEGVTNPRPPTIPYVPFRHTAFRLVLTYDSFPKYLLVISDLYSWLPAYPLSLNLRRATDVSTDIYFLSQPSPTVYPFPSWLLAISSVLWVELTFAGSATTLRCGLLLSERFPQTSPGKNDNLHLAAASSAVWGSGSIGLLLMLQSRPPQFSLI